MESVRLDGPRWCSLFGSIGLLDVDMLMIGGAMSVCGGPGYPFTRLDGNVTPALRQGLVDQFNEDRSLLLFLISTKAGGLGLNLTSASKVIIYDCNWNPTHDLQVSEVGE